MNKAGKVMWLRRAGGQALGWILVVVGVAALVLPGPGLLCLMAGLAVLSQQYAWARRRLAPVKARAFALAARGVRGWPQIVASCLGALLLIGIGIGWGRQPPVPGWWPLDQRWWLPGGWGTGSSLIGSGVIALILLAYSIRRFRTTAAPPDGSG